MNDRDNKGCNKNMTTARSLFGELRSALAGWRDDPTLVERVLDSSPPDELTVLAWLCEQLPSFDYSDADIERLFSGLRAKFKNEWLGVHVLSGDLAHHIDFAGRPSLGLFLAMTAPEEIDVEPFETEDSFSRSLDDARFHLLLDHVDRRADALECITRCARCIHHRGLYSWLFFRACADMNVDRATGSCTTETVDRIIDRFRLWPEHSKLFPRHWIPEDLTTWPEIVRACAWLDLSEHRALTQDDVLALTKCAQIRHITHLDVSCGFATASAERAFFSASCFARCRALSVKTDTKEFEGFDVLAGCSSFPYLESLCLETSWIPRGGFIRFAGSIAAKKIRSLVLRCPDIEPDFVKRVFVRGNLSHLETFVFVCAGLSNWSMLELASCRALLRLRLLRVDHSASDESNVMHALSDNPALGNLESLYLRGNSRDCSSALRTLAKPTNLSSLKDLSLAKNARSTRNTTPIRVVPGLKLRSWSVSNGVHFQRGRSLSARVSAGGEPDAVLRRVVVSPGDDIRGALTLDVIRGLTWIEVSNALVSSSDLSVLFSSKWFRYVEALNLRVGDERLIDELVSRPISSLAAARIIDSTRSATLAPRVLQSGAFPNVKSIVFERALGRDWPRLNMVSARWASVGEFGAIGYQIEDEDFARVCEAPELEELRVLRFERCSLFPESIKRLRSATFKDGLEELHFDWTDV